MGKSAVICFTLILQGKSHRSAHIKVLISCACIGNMNETANRIWHRLVLRVQWIFKNVLHWCVFYPSFLYVLTKARTKLPLFLSKALCFLRAAQLELGWKKSLTIAEKCRHCPYLQFNLYKNCVEVSYNQSQANNKNKLILYIWINQLNTKWNKFGYHFIGTKYSLSILFIIKHCKTLKRWI